MAHEDKTLTCVGCKEEFVFTADEQDFFTQKGFDSDPKRCKQCRSARRKNRNKKRKGDGIYRSPAFERSAPSHQKIRGGHHNSGHGEYRSPASFGKSNPAGDEYRSPAFRQYDQVKPEDEYRAPGFKEAADINLAEEYRAPGFKEHDDIDPREEYRAPAYRDLKEKYLDEKPMFAIVCAACGQDAMIPFLPEEDDLVFCQECYKASKAAEAKEAEAKEAEAKKAAELKEAVEEQAEPAANEPTE